MPNNFKTQCVSKHFSWGSNISQGDQRGKKKGFYLKKVRETFYSVVVTLCPVSK